MNTAPGTKIGRKTGTKTMALIAAVLLVLCVGCTGPGTQETPSTDPSSAPVAGTTSLPTTPETPAARPAASTAGSPPGVQSTTSPTSASTVNSNLKARQELALKAAAIMSTWSPATDFNRTDAEQRARNLMTTNRAQQINSPQRPASGAEWLKAASMNATSHPSVILQPATHQTDSVAVLSTWQWVAPTGETFTGEGSYVYYFTFTDDPPYKIRDYTYSSQ